MQIAQSLKGKIWINVIKYGLHVHTRVIIWMQKKFNFWKLEFENLEPARTPYQKLNQTGTPYCYILAFRPPAILQNYCFNVQKNKFRPKICKNIYTSTHVNWGVIHYCQSINWTSFCVVLWTFNFFYNVSQTAGLE